ncbi:MAG: fimbrillin family protein [Rikenellaceae bacterium]
MKSITYIKSLFGVVILAIACTKVDSGESPFDADSLPITFSTSKAQLSVTTKASETIAQGTTNFGSYSVSACSREQQATRVNSSGFEVGDQIGVYLYYNYWFDQYAESTILDDATLTIGSTSNSLDPQKLWTFSSLGGSVPTALLGQAYYPKAAGVEFTYGSGSHLLWEHDSTMDLLIASLHYYSSRYYTSGDDQGAQFKKYITETLGGTVELVFEHQLATLSFYIYKASDITDVLTIESLKVNYTCAKNLDSSTTSSWSEESVTKESILTVIGGGTLSTTAPTTPLDFENDIFLPPNTVINSIAFSFAGNEGEYTYTWHPHIVGMEVLNYQITFELDPDRNN